MAAPTFSDIQQLLDENSHLIRVIQKCQNEGRIMDALLYQTRLQLNILDLASTADGLPHPSFGCGPSSPSSSAPAEPPLQLSRFVSSLRRSGGRDLPRAAADAGISLADAESLAARYVRFLRRQRRDAEADALSAALSA